MRTLLTNAGVAVYTCWRGYSVGSKYVRMFALHFPEQVAGMVLVDVRSEYADDPSRLPGIAVRKRCTAMLHIICSKPVAR